MISQQIGQYEILGELGSGGMATVYKALHTALRREVALKVLNPQFTANPEFVQKFAEEAAHLAQLDYPGIVKVFDAGFDRDRQLYYIAMEYLDGQSAESAIEQQGILLVGQAVSIGIEVAAALEYAHARGLIHRDIKPSNIMLTKSGQVKVLDFGIAALLASGQKAKTRIGTPEYMPPEQAQGQSDMRSDLYALGATLYQLLTAQFPPLLAADAAAPPSRLNPTVRAPLDAVILKALQKLPANRQASAAELKAELQATVGATASQIQCASCGAFNRTDARFCNICGKTLAGGPAQLGGPATAAGPAVPVAPVFAAAPPSAQLISLYARGKQLLAQGQWQDAYDVLSQVQLLDPHYGDTMSLLGEAQMEMSRAQADQARPVLAGPSPFDPNAALAGADPRNRGRAAALLLIVILAVAGGWFVVGGGIGRAALSLAPGPTATPAPTATPIAAPTATTSPAAILSKDCQAFSDKKDWKAAAACFDRVQTLDANAGGLSAKLYAAHFAYGMLLVTNDDFGGAVAQFDLALKADPNAADAKTQKQLAATYLEAANYYVSGIWFSAAQTFEKVYMINPTYKDVVGKIYASYTNRGLTDYKSAEAYFLANNLQQAFASLRSAEDALRKALFYVPTGGEAQAALQSVNALYPRLTPTPTATPVPPTPTPRPTATPVLAADVTINIINQTGAVLTISIDGPWIKTYTIPAHGQVQITVPSGTYGYTMTASGFNTKYGTQTWTAGRWTWTWCNGVICF